jgi:hypothetical protein
MVKQNGSTISIETATVIEATGRSKSSLCAPTTKRIRTDKLVALAFLDQYQARTTLDTVETQVESIPCGWIYSTVLPTRHLLTVLYTDFDLLPSRESRSEYVRQAIYGAPYHRDRFFDLRQITCALTWRHFDARTSLRQSPIGRGWIAIGDALMSIDPLSGHGVLEALESGINTAEMFLRRETATIAAIREYSELIASNFNSLLITRAATYGMETRWRQSPFWQRRIPR